MDKLIHFYGGHADDDGESSCPICECQSKLSAAYAARQDAADIEHQRLIELQSQLAAALQDQHDESCDTRDSMIQGKPCNCYLLLKSQLAAVQTANGQLTADLMGCRDGALVRDLRAEMERLKHDINRHSGRRGENNG